MKRLYNTEHASHRGRAAAVATLTSVALALSGCGFVKGHASADQAPADTPTNEAPSIGFDNSSHGPLGCTVLDVVLGKADITDATHVTRRPVTVHVDGLPRDLQRDSLDPSTFGQPSESGMTVSWDTPDHATGGIQGVARHQSGNEIVVYPAEQGHDVLNGTIAWQGAICGNMVQVAYGDSGIAGINIVQGNN